MSITQPVSYQYQRSPDRPPMVKSGSRLTSLLPGHKQSTPNQPLPCTPDNNNDDDPLTQATIAQALSEQKRKQQHHNLASIQIPFCVAMGFMLYHGGMKIDPSRNILKNLKALLQQNIELRSSLNILNRNMVASMGVPSHLRVPLANLHNLLQMPDTKPSIMYPYMDRIRLLSSTSDPNLKQISRQVENYKNLLQRLMRDRKGFMLMAGEPRIQSKLGMGEARAKDLARNDRETFFVKLFGRGLGDPAKMGEYRNLFGQLAEAHHRKVRLLAFGLPGVLFGYFYSKLTMTDKKAENF